MLNLLAASREFGLSAPNPQRNPKCTALGRLSSESLVVGPRYRLGAFFDVAQGRDLREWEGDFDVFETPLA